MEREKKRRSKFGNHFLKVIQRFKKPETYAAEPQINTLIINWKQIRVLHGTLWV
jgi:hypothetical protein